MSHNRTPHHRRLAVAAAAFIGAIALYGAPALALTVGDAAPPLKVGKWLKGEPVAEFKPGQMYVVEFWATWCGPCRQTIPHLTELAHQNKDVTFIGQDVFERDDSAPAPFVQEMGDQMDYHVASDDKSAQPEGAMAQTWMAAANQDSIPTAFIVNKDGKIAWIGHPMEMGEPLKQVKAGTWDLEKAKKDMAAKQAKAAAMEAIQGELQAKVGPAMQANDIDGAIKALDEIIAAHPDSRADLLGVKFSILMRAGKADQAYAASDQIAELSKDDAQVLNQLAWVIASNPQIKSPDLDRAERYAKRAVEVTQEKEADPMDTLARVYANKGELAKAIEWQTKAVAAAPADAPEKPTLQKTLDEYTAKQQAAATQPAH